MKDRKALYVTVYVAIMAAIIFVATYFIRIEIPTPTGPTNIKMGNILCLVAGMLFGGIYGGLAAGIGSVFFDLLNPAYISSAPFTLVFFFTMGAVCGFISHSGGAKGLSTVRNTIGAICGAASYFVLHIGKNVVMLVIAGSEFIPAVTANVAKMITSGINAGIAVVVSVLIAKPLNSLLRKAGVLARIGK